MYRLSPFILALFGSVASLPESTFANDERLMRSTESAKVSLAYKIDGRAIFLTARNESALVVTSGTLYCLPYVLNRPRPWSAPDGRKWCYSNLDPVRNTGDKSIDDYLHLKERADEALVRLVNPQVCASPEPTLFNFKEKIFSKKTKELYFELYEPQPRLVDCRLQDLRGRETKVWEFYN